MYRVDFLNLPFAALSLPSLGLMQLKEVTDRRFGDDVSTNLHYLNHDFAEYFGVDMYQRLAGPVRHITTGVGDWMFRHVAFPELEDNEEAYFGRFYRDPQSEALRERVRERREGLADVLDEMIEDRDLLSADVVGMTSMFSTHGASLALARRIKEQDSSIVTVVGGANCEAPMGRVIADEVDCVDFVFSGPALRSFPRFLEAWMEGNEEHCHRIDGVFTERNVTEDPEDEDLVEIPDSENGRSGEEVPTVAALGPELDIDKTPQDLDYARFLEKLNDRFPEEQVDRKILFETSRGCWWGEKAHCTFCGLNGAMMNYRSLAPDKAKDLFDQLFELTDYADDIQLHCTDNIIPKSYLDGVLPELDTPESMHIFYEVKADLDEEDVRTLSEARVQEFQPGIEALSTEVLKLMRKGTTVFVNLELLKNCRRYDVFPAWNLLVGFPGEEEEVYHKYLEDLPLLTHLPPPTGVYPVRFDRYSPYFTMADHYDLELEPLDFYELTYPFDEERLEQMAYYFQDENYEADYKRHTGEYLRPLKEEMADWKGPWGDAEADPPRLALHRGDGRPWIRDTRPGFEDEYTIDPDEADVLEAMDTMTKIQLLEAELPIFSKAELKEIVSRLEERGLVFREEDRLISLELPADAYSDPEAGEERESSPMRAKLTA